MHTAIYLHGAFNSITSLLKQTMLLGTQLAVRILVCVSLVAFACAAKCYPEKCGDLEVSYPFYINKSDCGHHGFQIRCSKDEFTGTMVPFLPAYKGTNRSNTTPTYFKIMDIDYTGKITVDSTSLNVLACKDSHTSPKLFYLPESSPFSVSASNKVLVIGCRMCGIYGYGHQDNLEDYWGIDRCTPPCTSQNHAPYCSLYGCCVMNLQDNWKWIIIAADTDCVVSTNLGDEDYGDSDERCTLSNSIMVGHGLTTIMDPSTFTMVSNKTELFRGKGMNAYYGLRLNWGINDDVCPCSSKANCFDSPSGTGYICKCNPGYEGNGYLKGIDCADINECHNRSLNACVAAEEGGICLNYEGSYNCSCAKGYKGDGFQHGRRCASKSSHYLILAIVGSVSSFVIAFSFASLLGWWLWKRHLKFVEAKYFQQLQQYIASRVGRESLRMFSAKELAKASNNYSDEMVLGSGGFGTVFKGILFDGSPVAIKKSKQAFNVEDGHDLLNEVTILSQINHRNIVKLLGCCVQTKFPMLVSEFVPNGTLFEHLQSKEVCLPWVSRLQIAIETAEALAYLHSGAFQPIFHRDVKSSNILLNETFSPKVADFGISRLISASNNTHLTTVVMGTRGYLDPEYFQTYQLTDKSDVYSFGVVLVELITGLEPLCIDRNCEEWNLSSLFLNRINDNRLGEILDSKVWEEENLQQMEDMGRLARECLHLERRKRPSMKKVLEELLWVRGGARKTKFQDDAIFEQTSIFGEASQTMYRNLTFESGTEATSEEPSTALLHTFPSTEASEKAHRFRSYTFPSAVERKPGKPFTALLEMTKSEKVIPNESISTLF